MTDNENSTVWTAISFSQLQVWPLEIKVIWVYSMIVVLSCVFKVSLKILIILKNDKLVMVPFFSVQVKVS